MGFDQIKFHRIQQLSRLEQEAKAAFLIATKLEEALRTRVDDFTVLYQTAELEERTAKSYYDAVFDAAKKYKEVKKLADKAKANATQSAKAMKTVFDETYKVAVKTVKVANATVYLSNTVQGQAEKNPLISSFIQTQTGDTTSAATTAVKTILVALEKSADALEDVEKSTTASLQNAQANANLSPLINYNLWERAAPNSMEFKLVSFNQLNYDKSATVQSVLDQIRHLYVILKDDQSGQFIAQEVKFKPGQPATFEIPVFQSLRVPFQSSLTVSTVKDVEVQIINETSAVMGMENLLLIRWEGAREKVFEREAALKLAERMLAVAVKNLAVKETAYDAAKDKLAAAKEAVNFPA